MVICTPNLIKTKLLPVPLKINDEYIMQVMNGITLLSTSYLAIKHFLFFICTKLSDWYCYSVMPEWISVAFRFVFMQSHSALAAEWFLLPLEQHTLWPFRGAGISSQKAQCQVFAFRLFHPVLWCGVLTWPAILPLFDIVPTMERLQRESRSWEVWVWKVIQQA